SSWGRRGRRARGGDVRVVSLRTGDAGPGPVDPDVRRAAHLELPPLAAGLCGARVRRHAVAGLRRGAAALGARRLRQPQAPLRRKVSPLVSRIVVGAVGLPVVLGLLYLGGGWLFALAVVVAFVAFHEYTVMGRALRALALAGFAGVVLALLGAQLGGVDWAVGGFLATLPLAFLLHWVGTTRQSATVAISSTMLGTGWIGLGLAFLLLVRAL